MNPRRLSFFPLFLILLLFALLSAAADDEKKDEEEKVNPLTKAKNTLREKFAEIRKVSDKKAGLFDLYQDKRDGKVYLAIKPDQFDTEFIHFA